MQSRAVRNKRTTNLFPALYPFFFNFGKAFRSLRANPYASVLSLLTLTLCLLLLGAFILIYQGVQRSLPEWLSGAHAVAYLELDTQPADAEKLAEELRGWTEVESVQVVGREEAWKRLNERLGRWRSILEGVEDNPLPASLEIKFKPDKEDAARSARTIPLIRRLPGVDEVHYGEAVAGKLRAFVRLIHVLALGLVTFLALAVVLIVSNTVKLSIFSRREELEIFGLVGATRSFVAIPFYYEGLLLGLAGGIIASMGLWVLFQVLQHALPLPLAPLWSNTIDHYLILGAVLCSAGVALNWIGTLFALRRFLDY